MEAFNDPTLVHLLQENVRQVEKELDDLTEERRVAKIKIDTVNAEIKLREAKVSELLLTYYPSGEAARRLGVSSTWLRKKTKRTSWSKYFPIKFKNNWYFLKSVIDEEAASKRYIETGEQE